MRNVYPHIKMFSEGLQIKRTRQGKLYSRSDFDNWMWNYDVRMNIIPLLGGQDSLSNTTEPLGSGSCAVFPDGKDRPGLSGR